MQEIFVPAIAISRGAVAPENKEVLWEDISNMSLPFFERIKSYDSNTTQWRMVTQLPLELLNSLKKVDGDGSGLDANFLQGKTVNDIIQLAKDGSFTLPNGFIFVGNNLGEAEAKALSGDATLQSNGNLTLASSGVTAGTYNLASLTIDAKGRITNAVSYTISVDDIPELPQSKITGLVTDLSNRELIANKENSLIDTSTTKYPTVNLLKIGLDGKQDTLVSGTNIKTLNGDSLLGSGNIEIISENLATNNLNLPAATNRTFTLPADSTLDFGALMKLFGTGIVDFTSDVTVDNVQFKGGTGTQGEMSWSTDEETVKLIMDGTTLYMGQDTFVHVRNNTASIITKGTAVYATGTLGASGRITVAPMIADGTIPGRLFIGLAAEDIAIGVDGQVITFGKIRQIDTTAYNDGDVLWLSPTVSGGLTATEPTAPNLKIATAFVIHAASNGTLMVRAEQGNDLHSDQRVQVSGLTNGDVLTWDNTNQRWQNEQPALDTNFANTDLTLTGTRTHDLDGNILNINNGATNVFQVNEFNDVIARGKGGVNNLMLGFNTARNATTGINNVILGDLAGEDLTTASNVVLIGRDAGKNITTANNVVAIGRDALGNITVSSDNTAIGYNALINQTSGQFNIAIGSVAGSNLVSGGSNTFIGRNTQPLTNSDSNSIVIGKDAVGYGSNTAVLGNSDITRTILRGRVEMDTITNGILLPRLTTIQMNAIASPDTNLLIFNTDLKAIYRYDATLLQWVALSAGYGIIEVQSGTGTGQPTYFADLQSALETCKASGGYFTVKLYSNITITSAILIDYTGSGVGFAYQFRQLTIDFNGFSVTNAQADTSEGFDIRLSNSVSVYQEIRLINGNIIRTNGTGTHHALKINQTSRYGTIQMDKMLVYCENSLGCRLDLGISTADEAKRVCDLGGSTFISDASNAFRCDNANTIVKNFNALGRGSSTACVIGGGNVSEFYSENTSSGNAVSLTSVALKRVAFFTAKSNSGNGLLSDAISIDSVLSNFEVTSTSGIALRIDQPLSINNFVAITGNNLAVRIEGASDINNGKAVNNSSSECIYLINVNSANNLEGKNNGSGYGFRAFNNTTLRGELKDCKGISIGGMGGTISSTTVVTKVSGCEFVSHWNNAGGHALRVSTATGGDIQLSNSNFIVRNSGANVLNATSAVTVKSFSNTHNEVASTPINASVTITALASF